MSEQSTTKPANPNNKPTRRAGAPLLLAVVVGVLIGLVAAPFVLENIAPAGPLDSAAAPVATPVVLDETVDRNLYVSQTRPASDDNDGSAEAPLATFAVALRMGLEEQAQGRNVRIVLEPGVYREFTQTFAGDGENPGTLIIEAALPGTVTFSGSDVWSDWEADADNPQLYSAEWTETWGFAGNPWGDDATDLPQITRRSEMVFVDGTLLKQVLDADALYEGAYYVDEAAGRLIIWPNEAVDVATATIEVSTRRIGIEIDGAQNMIFRGINFQHMASGPDQAALTLRNCGNIIVEDAQFNWNNWAGLQFWRCEDVTVREIVANYNGVRGFGAWRMFNMVAENIESSYNNWRGALGDWHDWDSGQKFLLMHGAIFRNFTAIGNEAPGLWLDFDVRDVEIINAELCDNFLAGIFIEANAGPITLSDSTICDTRAGTGDGFWNAGVFSTNSEQVTLRNNLIYGNDYAQIRYLEPEEREVFHAITDESYFPELNNWLFEDNRIFVTRPEQVLFSVRDDLNMRQIRSVNNIWAGYEGTESFIQPGRQSFRDWQQTANVEGDRLDPDVLYQLPTLLAREQAAGLQFSVYTNGEFSGTPLQLMDNNISFNWLYGNMAENRTGAAPIPITAVWAGELTPPFDGNYTFTLRGTGFADLVLDGDSVLVNATDNSRNETSTTLPLTAGQPYSLELIYTGTIEEPEITLYWSHEQLPRQIIPAEFFTPSGNNE